MAVPTVHIADEAVTEASIAGLMAAGGVPLREVCLGRVAPDPALAAAVPRFAEFLMGGAEPPPEKSWLNDEAMKSAKMVLANDRYGNCVIASDLHAEGVSSANESGTATLSSDSEAVSEYFRLCGHLGNDVGCIITQVKDAKMTGGISCGGKRRKSLGYAAIPPSNELAVKTAILIAGAGVNIGFNVPSKWMGSATYDGAVWDLPITGSRWMGGHDMRAISYNAIGVQFSTWGVVVTMTWRALADARIVDEMYVELPESWNTDGTAPSGIDTAGLKAALEAFRAGKVPEWQPTSPPPPAPPSPPVPPSPGTGLTGTETTVYDGGRVTSRTFVPGKAPVVKGDAHEIDLSHVGPIRRLIVRRKIAALIEDNEYADFAYRGNTIVLTRAAGVDWDAFLAFLEKLLPLILKIIDLFG